MLESLAWEWEWEWEAKLYIEIKWKIAFCGNLLTLLIYYLKFKKREFSFYHVNRKSLRRTKYGLIGLCKSLTQIRNGKLPRKGSFVVYHIWSPP